MYDEETKTGNTKLDAAGTSKNIYPIFYSIKSISYIAMHFCICYNASRQNDMNASMKQRKPHESRPRGVFCSVLARWNFPYSTISFIFFLYPSTPGWSKGVTPVR